MSLSARSPLALAGALLALALASCGEEDAQLLPGETAREITTNLDAVKQLADEGDCVGAENAALQVSEQIEELRVVDERLKQALRTGAARLNEVVAECEESPTEAIAPATIPTEAERTTDKDKGSAGGKGRGDGQDEDDEGNGNDERQDGDGDRGTPGAGKGPPSLPPQAKGEGQGPPDEGGEENDGGAAEGGGESGGEETSGGISPGSPADEGE